MDSRGIQSIKWQSPMAETSLFCRSNPNQSGIPNGRKRPLPNQWTAVLAGLIVANVTALAGADDFSRGSEFYSRLSTSLTVVQDGKPFRDALETTARQVGLNLWLDRQVNPSVRVAAGPVGQTAAAALQQLAAEQNCVMMPVANVVLVGRPSWVESTAVVLIEQTQPTHSPQPQAVRWDALTTPSEALAQASGRAQQTDPPLPHDLWPAVDWQDIDRSVAIALVLAQFDLCSDVTSETTVLPTKTFDRSGPVTRRYDVGKYSNTLRSFMQKTDAASRFRVAGKWLQATGSIAAHRAAVDAVLAAQASEVKTAGGNDNRRFSLKQPLETQAKNALGQFAQTAGRKLVIDPDAQQACDQIVRVTAKDNTLRELIDQVAAAAGVVATWDDQAITITLKP